MIYCIGSTHKTDGIENLSEKRRELSEHVCGMGISDYVLLTTCNRVELYSTSELEFDGFERLEGLDAIRHLFRVAAGLESMVVGENEVLGQVREAYKTAISGGHCSDELSQVFESAVRIGGRVRAKTRISEGKTSIASIAVDYALNQDTYPTERVAVIGSGSMGAKIASALKNKGVAQIFLANRRMDRARALAEKVGGKVVDYHRLREFLGNTDVVFTATSAPHPIIRADMIFKGKNTLFIDLGVPPDVSEKVDGINGVEVVRLAYFKGIADENNKGKKQEALKAQAVIDAKIRAINH